MIIALSIGFFLGALTHRTSRESSVSLPSDVIMGGLGGFAGGLLVHVVDAVPFDRLSGWSVAFALLGALSSLIVYRAFVFPRRARPE